MDNGHPDLTVEACGLFISRLINWLAATPDGIVNDPSCTSDIIGLVKIKCPFSFRDTYLDEACKKPSFCLSVNKESQFKLKNRHDYWFQIQGQLYCVDKTWCDFVVRTNKQLHVERIYRDAKWWGLQLTKLKKIFTSLPYFQSWYVLDLDVQEYENLPRRWRAKVYPEFFFMYYYL